MQQGRLDARRFNEQRLKSDYEARPLPVWLIARVENCLEACGYSRRKIRIEQALARIDDERSLIDLSKPVEGIVLFWPLRAEWRSRGDKRERADCGPQGIVRGRSHAFAPLVRPSVSISINIHPGARCKRRFHRNMARNYAGLRQELPSARPQLANIQTRLAIGPVLTRFRPFVSVQSLEVTR